MELEIVPLCPFQYTAPALRFAVLFSNVEFASTPFSAPSCQSIAPPFVPAVLPVKCESLTVMLALLLKYIAPPRRFAVLLVNVRLLIVPCVPVQITAPPSPPVPSSSLTSPVAWLLMKLVLVIVPLCPFQYTAPPLRFAVLFSNREFDMLPFSAPSLQSTAPPLFPAVLL